MTEFAIDIAGLKKNYGDIEAVRGIDLRVPVGEVFALLGPNGAGKTTTVEILEGHRKRTGGSVYVLGHDPENNERRFKQRIGIVLQKTGVEPYLNVEETIKLFAGYYQDPESVQKILEITGLEKLRLVRVQKLSGGQLRRLDVAIGLVGNPELLFLDEPTTGFDPAARRSAWEMISNLRTLGKTVFLTTHYMEEAEYLADRVAIMVNGTIVAEGTTKDLAGQASETAIKFRLAANNEPLPQHLLSKSTSIGDSITIHTDTPTQTLYEITNWSINTDNHLEEITVSRPSLEEIYLKLVDQSETQID